MKRRHIVTLIATLGLAVLLTVGLLTGSALAAPSTLDNHQPLTVTGTVEFVDWVLTDGAKEYDKGGYHYSTGNLLTWTLHGDLEGTYVMSITYIWPLSNPAAYKFEGRATFKGTILGVKTGWTARVRGSGLMDYSDPANHPFKGEESWTSTLTSSMCPLSHMRGCIVTKGAFDYGVTPDRYRYSGLLVW